MQTETRETKQFKKVCVYLQSEQRGIQEGGVGKEIWRVQVRTIKQGECSLAYLLSYSLQVGEGGSEDSKMAEQTSKLTK